ncbi:MAG: efflux RND transporter permease subunit, partial [Acetobacteraceae bacterium]
MPTSGSKATIASQGRRIPACSDHRYPAFTRRMIGPTIIIFTPLAFLNGMIGEFFKALAITMASALLISFLIAWLVVPILSGWLLSKRDIHRDDVGPIMRRVNAGYRWSLQAGMRRPWL